MRNRYSCPTCGGKSGTQVEETVFRVMGSKQPGKGLFSKISCHACPYREPISTAPLEVHRIGAELPIKFG